MLNAYLCCHYTSKMDKPNIPSTFITVDRGHNKAWCVRSMSAYKTTQNFMYEAEILNSFALKNNISHGDKEIAKICCNP